MINWIKSSLYIGNSWKVKHTIREFLNPKTGDWEVYKISMPLEAQDERYNQRALANFGKYYGVEVRTRVVTVIVKKGEPTIVVDNFDNRFGVIHQAMEGQYFYGYSIPSKYRIKAKKPRIPKMYRPETRISPV